MSRLMPAGTKSPSAKQKARQWNVIHSVSTKHRRAKAIERGEVASIFQPESKRLAPDVRASIDAAVAAGRVTKVPRGVSGIDYVLERS